MALDTQGKITIDTEQGKQSLRDLQNEIKAAQGAMLTAEEGSAEYAKALEVAANKSFQLREAQEAIRGTANDLGATLENGVRVVSGLASGFAAAQGALALFGVENENLEKGLLKVQAAMAIATGLQGLEGLGKSFGFFLKQLQSFPIIQKVVTAAQWLWNTALAANPIVAAIAAIVALTAALYGVSKILQASEEELIKERTALDGVVFASEDAAEAHNEHLMAMEDLEDQLLVLRGEMTELEYDLKSLNREYERVVKDIKKNTKKELEEATNFWGRLGFGLRNFGKSQEEVEKAYREHIIDIAKSGQQEIEDKEREFEARKKIREEEAKREAKREAERAAREAEREAEEKRRQQEKEIRDAINHIKKLDDELKAAQKEIDDANDEDLLADLEEQDKKQQEQDAKFLEAQQKASDNVVKIKETELKRLAELEKEKRDLQINAVQDTFNTISSLSELFAGQSEKSQKKAFEIQKAASIASAIIDTYRAAQNAAASTPGGPIIKAIAVAAVVAAGLANVKKIASQKFEGSSSNSSTSTGSSVSSNSVSKSAPSISQSITPTRNQLTQEEINLQNNPIKAYVVETDITATQNKVNATKKEASY